MKRTLSQMQEICRQWEQSGLSRRAFCKQYNIAYQTFNYWHKRIDPKEGSGFTEVVLPVKRNMCFELTFPSGARMSFEGEPCVNWLKALIG